MSNMHILTDLMIEQHRHRYAVDSSDLAPMLITVRNDEPIGIYVSPNFTDPDFKCGTIPMIAKLVKNDEADSYVFTTEGWMASDDNMPPSQHPNKIEIVMVGSYSKDITIHKIMEIIRNADNSVEDLVDSNIKVSMSRFDIYNRESIN